MSINVEATTYTCPTCGKEFALPAHCTIQSYAWKFKPKSKWIMYCKYTCKLRGVEKHEAEIERKKADRKKKQSAGLRKEEIL